MKKIIISFILTLVLSAVSYAQTEIDKCFNYFKAGDYHRAIESGKKAVKLYPRSVYAYFCLGIAYIETGDINLAIEALKKTEAYAVRDDELMVIYNNLGSAYSYKGDLDNALLYYSRSLDLAKKLGKRDFEATNLNDIALIFHKKGELDRALKYFEEALKLENNEKYKTHTYNNIAAVYCDKKDYKKAIEYFKKAIEINERHGDYHNSGKIMLNLGWTYLEIKDFENAYFYLDEGLKRVKKVGDKYWEAYGYRYFGRYYLNKEDRELAREYLNKAYNLYKSIGAEMDAQAVLLDLLEIASLEEKEKNKAVYGGIEIGSKGVKAMVLSISPSKEEGFYNVEEKFRKSINTGIITGVKETGVFSEEAIKETVDAVKELFNIIKGQYGVDEKNIFIAASSALVNVKNRDELSEKIKKLVGKDVFFITKQDEVFYNILGAVPQKFHSKALVIDIGSGNTKIGYIEGSQADSRIVSIEIPYGTVSFTELIQKDASTQKQMAQVAEKLIQKEVSQSLYRESQRKPALRNRNPVFMVGGIVWAMVTMLHPEKQDAFVKITHEEIERFYREIKKNPEKLLNLDLSKIKDENKRQWTSKQIQAVKDTFSKENLLAGASLLKGISDSLYIKGKEVYFSRYGSWLWGFIASSGVYLEQNKR
ncbi:tetratricopeptide repeat protein [Thermodesulfovibrio sp. 3907-1M]|uniref:Tetratricopeptide repeat protein n=1 Tax=Thermodesulfovibrio autotrophicus TaxID=3118333 RepID=A0AAU8GWQ1_9BACT